MRDPVILGPYFVPLIFGNSHMLAQGRSAGGSRGFSGRRLEGSASVFVTTVPGHQKYVKQQPSGPF